MKRILFAGILTILFVGVAFAQAPKIGVTAGLNVSSVTGDVEDVKFKAGFKAGVVADFAITENFSVIPELLFAQRGFKYEGALDEEDISGKATITTTLNYLQLPVNVAYKFDVGYGSKLFIFAGPYLGYGLSTSMKAKGKADGVEVTISIPDEYKVNFGSKEGEFKTFDFGLNAGIGYQYEKIFFKLQYNLGLANMSNTKGTSIKNSNIGVSVGYFFN
jgi:hypothetical protein